MTREQLLDCTFPLPVRKGDPDQGLRGVLDYTSPPSQAAFDGPVSARELRDFKPEWEAIPSTEVTEFAWKSHACDIEALERAFVMADQGHAIYACRDEDGPYLAVEVLHQAKKEATK